jgi:DNA-binding response OmpR family regulator
MKILIVEDEMELLDNIVNYLKGEDFSCETAPDFYIAQEKIALYQYDCILVDITLPGGNGLKLLETIREKQSSTGIIIISAKDAVMDKITGLRLGADDYLAKPFHMSELSARVYSVIRRLNFGGSNTFTYNELKIDLSGQIVYVYNKEVPLSRKETDLLLFLVANKNRVISKNAIAEHLSGDRADMFDNFDFIYAHIKNLKRKLMEAGSEDYIKTIYGAGYKFIMNEAIE